MVGVLEPAPPLWLQRYEKSEPSMNIHGPAKVNTSYKPFTVRIGGVFQTQRLLWAVFETSYNYQNILMQVIFQEN